MADDNLSVYRLFKDIHPELILTKLDVLNDAITSGTDFDLGLYKPLNDGIGGAAINRDVFADGMDLSSANTDRGSPTDGMQTVGIEDSQKRIYEHAADTFDTKEIGYDIALTGVVVGSSVGTIAVFFEAVYG